jgi:hypothetical protein
MSTVDLVGIVTMVTFNIFLVVYLILMVANFWEEHRETSKRIRESNISCQSLK